MPVFSVIIPAYNRAKVLCSAIDSVLQQKFKDFELIIVDDGSEDETKELVSSYQIDTRLKYLYQFNQGVSAARNTGIRNASADYIVFLDSDDIVNENWLKDFYEVLFQKNYDYAICGIKKIQDGINELVKQSDNVLLAGSFAIKRQLFFSLGGYDENLRYGENTELRWRLQRIGASYKEIVSANLTYFKSKGHDVWILERIKTYHYLLDKYNDKFKKEPKLAQTYHQIAGVDYIKSGNRIEGLKLLLKGYISYPFRVRAFLRLAYHLLFSI